MCINFCFQVPSYVSDFVVVTAWVQDNGMTLYPNTDIGGKYSVLANGDLYINNAGPSDGYKQYQCRTLNKLTGKASYDSTFVFCHFVQGKIEQAYKENRVWEVCEIFAEFDALQVLQMLFGMLCK